MVEVQGKAISVGERHPAPGSEDTKLDVSKLLNEPQPSSAAGAGKADLANTHNTSDEADLTRISKSEGISFFPTSVGVSSLCPSCGSSQTVHNGSRKLSDGKHAGLLKCNDCGRKFSENYIRVIVQNKNRQICAEAKNLSVTEKTAVTSDEKDIKGLLLEYHVRMQLQGYKDSTIRLSESVLRTLVSRGALLTEPETIKKVIANQSNKETAYNGKIWSGSRKRNVINAYTDFLEYLGMTWDAPLYEIIRKLPFIPTEQEIDDLVAGSPNILAAFLQLLKETGMRRGEAIAVPWKDVDLERRIIYCNNPEKGSNSRIFSDLSGKLLNMLSNLPRGNDLIFGLTTNEHT